MNKSLINLILIFLFTIGCLTSSANTWKNYSLNNAQDTTSQKKSYTKIDGHSIFMEFETYDYPATKIVKTEGKIPAKTSRFGKLFYIYKSKVSLLKYLDKLNGEHYFYQLNDELPQELFYYKYINSLNKDNFDIELEGGGYIRERKFFINQLKNLANSLNIKGKVLSEHKTKYRVKDLLKVIVRLNKFDPKDDSQYAHFLPKEKDIKEDSQYAQIVSTENEKKLFVGYSNINPEKQPYSINSIEAKLFLIGYNYRLKLNNQLGLNFNGEYNILSLSGKHQHENPVNDFEFEALQQFIAISIAPDLVFLDYKGWKIRFQLELQADLLFDTNHETKSEILFMDIVTRKLLERNDVAFSLHSGLELAYKNISFLSQYSPLNPLSKHFDNSRLTFKLAYSL